MKTIIDCIRILRDTAEMLMDRSERERQRGDAEASFRDAVDAGAYRRTAEYLEAVARHDQNH